MKRVLTLILTIAMTVVSCTKEDKNEPYNPDGSPITQAQALEIVKEDIEQYDLVYVTESIVKKGTSFKPSLSVSREVKVQHDSWIVMIDSDPWANGGRKWIYIYVDAYTGNADDDSWEWGLPKDEDIDIECVKNDLSKYTVSEEQESCSKSLMQTKAVTSVSNNWAVIISGGANMKSNFERYWNDCSAVYKCLRNVYNYRRDRIFVIMSDGKSESLDQRHLIGGGYTSSSQDLDGDGTDDINYSATKSNISQVFDYLGAHVSSDEQVLIFVTDHGATDNGKSYIWLWDDKLMSADELSREIKKIDVYSRKHVVMGQCYSGGFVNPLLKTCSNISIATAASANQESNAMSGLAYDEFLYHWVSAAAGRTPGGTVTNADLNGYDGVSVEEMFRYAENNDVKNETPQYSSHPESIGEKYGLSEAEFGYPVFSGPYDVSSSSNDNRFELSALPSEGYSVVWTSSSNISVTPVGQTSAMIRNVAPEAMEKGWVKAEVMTPFKTYTLREPVHLWRPGLNITTDLISGSIEEGYFSLPYYVEGTDTYDWYIGCPDYDFLKDDAFQIDFEYTGDGNPEPYYVSVRFDNPLGESTTIVKYYE